MKILSSGRLHLIQRFITLSRHEISIIITSKIKLDVGLPVLLILQLSNLKVNFIIFGKTNQRYKGAPLKNHLYQWGK